MAVATHDQPRAGAGPETTRSSRRDIASPAYQAFLMLWIGFTALPILFGIDKFFDVLVDWKLYLAPEFNDLIPGNAHEAMLAIGVIEIVAGLLVFVKPRLAAYVVAGWLAGIIVDLMIAGDFYDVALRDFGLLVAALALARLARSFDHPVFGRRPS